MIAPFPSISSVLFMYANKMPRSYCQGPRRLFADIPSPPPPPPFTLGEGDEKEERSLSIQPAWSPLFAIAGQRRRHERLSECQKHLQREEGRHFYNRRVSHGRGPPGWVGDFADSLNESDASKDFRKSYFVKWMYFFLCKICPLTVYPVSVCKQGPVSAVLWDFWPGLKSAGWLLLAGVYSVSLKLISNSFYASNKNVH